MAWLVEGGDENDIRRAAVLDEAVRHFEAVEARHLDVQKDHLGGEPFDDPDGLQAVAGLRDHLDAPHLIQHVAQLFPGQLFVVDDDGLHGLGCAVVLHAVIRSVDISSGISRRMTVPTPARCSAAPGTPRRR